jgi:hypothetical protein
VNEFETQVMAMLLHGEHAILAALRDQLAVASIAGREFTGVGFFTRFDVPPTVARLPSLRQATIQDVRADVAGLQHGAGFILFVDGGVLDTLECYIYEDAWPANASLNRLYYVRPKQGRYGSLMETTERDLTWAIEEASTPTS